MKVLFLTNIPAPYRVAFFNELGKLCDLTVTFEGRSATDRNAAWVGEKDAYFTARYMKGKRIKSDQFFCPEVISVIKEKYDAIIFGGYTSPTAILAMAYLKLKQTPYYIEVDGGLIRQDSRPKYWLKKMLLGSANGWFSTGEQTTKYLVHYGAKREKVFTYPFTSLREADILPVVVTLEEKKRIRQELGLEREKVLLAVGQFIPRKGFDILLQAAAGLPKEIGIYIIGGEPTKEYLALCQSLGLSNVYFHGFQSKESLARYYKAADIFVLPTREDIWGLVINEAMSYGLPIITTNKCVAGLELIKNGKNGYIVPVADVEALREAMIHTLSGNLIDMGTASLESVRPYTIENMARVHLKILKREN